MTSGVKETHPGYDETQTSAGDLAPVGALSRVSWSSLNSVHHFWHQNNTVFVVRPEPTQTQLLARARVLIIPETQESEKKFEVSELNGIATFSGGLNLIFWTGKSNCSAFPHLWHHMLFANKVIKGEKKITNTRVCSMNAPLNVQLQRRYYCSATNCRQQFSSFGKSKIKLFFTAPSQMPHAL